jgi:hypothetical protein
VVEALEGLRGGQCPGAVTMVAARGDLTRGENARHVMTSLGLIPAAYASGERRRPGSIPTTGHPHARRRLHTWRWARNTPRPRGIPLTGQAACDACIALHTPASMPVNRLVVQDFLFCATNNHSS